MDWRHWLDTAQARFTQAAKIALLRQAAAAIEEYLVAHPMDVATSIQGWQADPPWVWQALAAIPEDDTQWQTVQRHPVARRIVASLTHDDYDILLDALAAGPWAEYAIAWAQPAVRPRFNAVLDQVRDWLLDPAKHPLAVRRGVSST